MLLNQHSVSFHQEMVQRRPFLQLSFSQGSIFRALDKGEILQAGGPFNINSYLLFWYEKLADDLAPKHIMN